MSISSSSNDFDEVRLSKSVVVKIFLLKFLKGIAKGVACFLVAYLVIAPFTTRVLFTDKGTETVASPNFYGGIPRSGQVLMVDPGRKDLPELVNNLIDTVTYHNKSLMKVEVVDAVAGAKDWGKYGIDRKAALKSDEYIVKCVDRCEKSDGTDVNYGVVKSKWITGIPTNEGVA